MMPSALNMRWGKLRKNKRLPLRLGVSTSGDLLVEDLADVHSLLLTGPTGAGKSVAVHTMLGSLLGCKSPEEMQLLLIDGKGLEFTEYTCLPHLVRPPVETEDGIRAAVRWLRRETESRAVRHAGTGTVPDLVVVIDGMVFAFDPIIDVEEEFWYCIEEGAAVGVHFIITSQTEKFMQGHKGSIASHLRISGEGHMRGMSGDEEIDVQGENIGDELVRRQVAECQAKRSAPSDSDEDIFADDTEEDRDAIKRVPVTGTDVRSAIELILNTNRASTSHFQRKFGWGYAHAAAVLDRLESMGVIAAQDGMGPRQIIWAQSKLAEYIEDTHPDEICDWGELVDEACETISSEA